MKYGEVGKEGTSIDFLDCGGASTRASSTVRSEERAVDMRSLVNLSDSHVPALGAPAMFEWADFKKTQPDAEYPRDAAAGQAQARDHEPVSLRAIFPPCDYLKTVRQRPSALHQRVKDWAFKGSCGTARIAERDRPAITGTGSQGVALEAGEMSSEQGHGDSV